MPTNTFNLGKDCTLVLIAPTGVQTTLSIVEGFEAKQAVHSLRIRPLNGPPQGADLPDGWNGTFTVERASNAADDLFSQMEQNFWAGGIFGVGQIFQYIQEVDQSTSTYQYNNVTMHLSDAGSYKADSSVKQTIAFFASTRTPV
jgi:hypothetical protein